MIGTRSFNELQVLLAEADAAASQVARPAAASSATPSTPPHAPPPDTPAPAVTDGATSSEAPTSPAPVPGQTPAEEGTLVGDLLGAEELVPAGSPAKPAAPDTSQPSDVPHTAGDIPRVEAASKALDAIDLLWADAPAESASVGEVAVGADGTAACEGAAAVGERAVGGAEASALAASEEEVPAAAADGAEGSAALASSSVATDQQQVEQQQQQQQQAVEPQLTEQQQVVEPQLTEQQVQRAQQLLRDGRVVRTFLERNCSQLTWAGLQAMSRHLRPNQLAVFFRNDHFNVVFKHEDQLYLLVTDEGYRGWTNVVWERLDRQVVQQL